MISNDKRKEIINKIKKAYNEKETFEDYSLVKVLGFDPVKWTESADDSVYWERLIELIELNKEVEKHLMPKGAVEWPKFKDGTPVKLGDEYRCWCGKKHVVDSVSIKKDLCKITSNLIDDKGHHAFIITPKDSELTCHGHYLEKPISSWTEYEEQLEQLLENLDLARILTNQAKELAKN